MTEFSPHIYIYNPWYPWQIWGLMFLLRHRLQLCSTQHRGNPAYEPRKWRKKGKKKKNIRERERDLLPQEVNLQRATFEDLLLLSYRRMQLLLQHQSILLLALLQQASIACDQPWRSIKPASEVEVQVNVNLSYSPSESIPYKWPVTVPSIIALNTLKARVKVKLLLKHHSIPLIPLSLTSGLPEVS